ncbi:uncharacterized protein LOC131672556 [Phymastichus coffea]|uniref:uncharacterized protein LOC131672556 n=1 Tax=Phymastichus coffea TaxID=108790 RepID=UPI00273AC4A3|nr:uncharacterized protein LOC131672556 [Phymastichus coffea]
MPRSPSSRDEQESVRSAQANVGLAADDIWCPGSCNRSSYRRLNRRLWIRCCKIAEKYAKLGSATRSQRRVRDVIPESRLATYGDFEYEDETGLHPSNGSRNNDDKQLPWMLDEVEEYLARIADAGKRSRSIRQQVTKRDETSSDSHKSSNQTASVREDRDKTPALSMREINEITSTTATPPRFSVTNVSEAQLEGRIFSEAVRNLWRSPSPPRRSTTTTLAAQQRQQHQQRQQQLLHHGLRDELQRELGLLRTRSRASSDVQQTHSNFQAERLRMPSRLHYPYVQTLSAMQQQRAAPLCVEVPEFLLSSNSKSGVAWPLPATTTDDHAKYAESPYQDDAYSYKAHVQTASRKAVALYQNTLMPMVPTPIVSTLLWPSQTWAQRILPSPVPIHQIPTPPPAIPIPAPAPAPMCPIVVHRPPVRLTEATANKHPTTAHKHIPVYQRTAKINQEYPQRRKSQGVDFNNLILLTKSAMKVRKTQVKPARKSFAESARTSHVKPDAATTRWLDKGYQKREREFVSVSTSQPSGVGRATTSSDDEDEEAATASPPARDAEAPSLEGSYDELERQAMEQYRSSEECLALRYQELEQQALEQYRAAESTESIHESARTNRRNDKQEKIDNVNDVDDNDDDDADGQTRDCCSSGFGKCKSPDLADEEKEERAEQRPARTRIHRAEVQRVASEGSLRRPIAVARRLPQSRSQKITDRGTLDDSAVKASSSLSSLKRRLAPMLPAERTNSDGCPATTKNLDPVKVAVQTLDKHVATYYRSNNISQTGSGDAKVNSTAVWMSDFWS